MTPTPPPIIKLLTAMEKAIDDPFKALETMKEVYDAATPEEKKAIDELFDDYEKYKKEHEVKKQ